MAARWLVLLLLAGCLGTQTTDSAAPTTSGETPDAATPPSASGSQPTAGAMLVQAGCRTHYSFHSIDPEIFAHRIPEGFTAAQRDDDGVYFAVKSWECAASTIDGDPVDGRTTLYYIAVEPEETAQQAADWYWVVIEILTSSELAPYYEQFRFPTKVLDDWNTEFHAIGSRQVYASHGSAPATRMALEVTIDENGAGRSNSTFVVRYFAVEDGAIVGILDIDVVNGYGAVGESVLSLQSADSPFIRPVQGEGQAAWWAPNEVSYVWTPR